MEYIRYIDLISIVRNNKVKAGNIYFTEKGIYRINIYLKPELYNIGINTNSVVNWNEVQNKPTEFNPIDHTHDPIDINQNSNNRFVTDTEKNIWNNKQNTLVSGSNIKTINGDSILGAGNYTIVKSKEINGSVPAIIDGSFNDFYIDASSADVYVIFDIAAVKDLAFDFTMAHEGNNLIIETADNTETLSLEPLPYVVRLYNGENLTIRSDGTNLWIK